MTKIQDTINQDFNISNFIDLNEVEEFVKDLPIVKDILMVIDDIFKTFTEIYETVMKIVNQVLAFINELLSLFDSLGIKDLIDKLTNFISSLFTGFGLTIKDTNSFENLFVTSCNYYNDTLNNKFNLNFDMFSFGLIAITQALLCAGVPGSLKAMHDIFNSDDRLTEDNVNEIFSNTIPMVLKDNSNINSIDFLNDITALDIGKNVNSYIPNFSETSLNYIENDKSENSFDDVTNIITNIEPSFKETTDITIFKNKNKIKDLAKESLLGKVNNISEINEVSFETLTLF